MRSGISIAGKGGGLVWHTRTQCFVRALERYVWRRGPRLSSFFLHAHSRQISQYIHSSLCPQYRIGGRRCSSWHLSRRARRARVAWNACGQSCHLHRRLSAHCRRNRISTHSHGGGQGALSRSMAQMRHLCGTRNVPAHRAWRLLSHRRKQSLPSQRPLLDFWHVHFGGQFCQCDTRAQELEEP